MLEPTNCCVWCHEIAGDIAAGHSSAPATWQIEEIYLDLVQSLPAPAPALLLQLAAHSHPASPLTALKVYFNLSPQLQLPSLFLNIQAVRKQFLTKFSRIVLNLDHWCSWLKYFASLCSTSSTPDPSLSGFYHVLMRDFMVFIGD